MPEPRNGLLMLLAGALMVGGHIGIYYAYRIGSVRSVAPFMYSLTIWAVLAGVVLFGDFPNTLAMIGIGLVMLAGLLTIAADSRRRPESAVVVAGESRSAFRRIAEGL